MMRRNSLKTLAFGAASLGALALSLGGCGRMGPLKQPAPLFGERAKAEYEAQQAADARAAADKKAAHKAPDATRAADQPDDDNTPKTKREYRAPEQQLTPAARTPIAGAPDLMGRPVNTTPPN
jgi:hypothetical protein